MADLIYISDTAYDYLVSRAIDGEFVNSSSIRRSGVGKFLNMLSRIECNDTRPEYLQKLDGVLIKNGKTPLWSQGTYLRRARLITIDYSSIERFCKTAVYHRIFMGSRYIGGPKPRSPISIAGAVIEAIGLELLSPIYWPYNKKYKAVS